METSDDASPARTAGAPVLAIGAVDARDLTRLVAVRAARAWCGTRRVRARAVATVGERPSGAHGAGACEEPSALGQWAIARVEGSIGVAWVAGRIQVRHRRDRCVLPPPGAEERYGCACWPVIEAPVR